MFCRNCGKEVDNNAAVCPGCGVLVTETQTAPAPTPVVSNEPSGANKVLGTIAKILLIVGVICTAWCVIPLAWTLPITIKINNRLKNNEPISTGLKICALILVNTVAGILLLCRKDN